MTLRLPKFLPMSQVLPVLGAIFLIQVVEGTGVPTALEFNAFLLVTASAFNAVGGLIYPSGAYIFFFSLLTVGVGGFLKTILGEPLDTNVSNAQRSLLVYLATACSLWVAAKLCVQLRARRPWLARFQLDHRVRQAALGSALLAQYGWVIIPLAMLSTFNQVNNFFPLAILMLTYTRTKETHGRSSYSHLALAIWFYATYAWGILAFSKQGMFVPSAVWAIGSVTAGYKASLRKLAAIAVCAAAAVAFLTPVSQIGRNYKNNADARDVAWQLVSHPLDTRRQYEEFERAANLRGEEIHWFNSRQGIFDRLTMFPIDDALMQITDQGRQLGWLPIEERIVSTVPRYLLPGEKTPARWGNVYAHELGMLAKSDLTTGISFSAVSDAYHCVRWWGPAICLPLFLLMFLVADSLTGSTEQTFWATMYIMIFAHSAPEGMLSTMTSSVSVYAFGFVLAAVLTRYFLPYVGGLLMPLKSSDSLRPVMPHWNRGPVIARTIESKL